jgi:MFS transporter, PAT family, beta-lactamase induction signal transducer AmpG
LLSESEKRGSLEGLRSQYAMWRKMMVVAILGFSSGFPFLLSCQVIQSWFTDTGVSKQTVAVLSLVLLPYSLKFLWAPLLDRFAAFGKEKRRSWIIVFQFFIFCILLSMSRIHLRGELNSSDYAVFSTPLMLIVCSFFLAFFSASQDIVIDAYRVDFLLERERPSGSAVTQFSYRVGLLLAGSGVLIAEHFIGWAQAYFLASLIMLACLMYSIFCLPFIKTESSPQTLYHALTKPLLNFMSKPGAVMIFLFVLLYKLSEYMVLSNSVYFLQAHIGFQPYELGEFSKPANILGIVLGSIIAASLMRRWSLLRSLYVFGVLQMLSNSGYILLVWSGHNDTALFVSFFIENVFNGMATIAFLTFLMGLCDRRVSATQYALFTALMVLPRALLGPLFMQVERLIGWNDFYILSCFMGLPALIVLYFLQRQGLVCNSAPNAVS